MTARKKDSLEPRARELCRSIGVDPDSRMVNPNGKGEWPAWCAYRDAARAERNAMNSAGVINEIAQMTRDPRFDNSPLRVFGQHEAATIEQMQVGMSVGNVVGGVLCADGHLGYCSQPVGGVIAYEDQISISGVGFDIACGNMAVRLDVKYDDIKDRAQDIMWEIRRQVSFGVGRSNDTRVEHSLFDTPLWKDAGIEELKQKARSQLGTVGSGNHYVDLFHDEDGYVWVGVHFGSRGVGHTIASKFLKLAGGKDAVHAVPTVVSSYSDLGEQYYAGMQLAGLYAYAGREWVVDTVRKIVGGEVTKTVHNHHNYAWREHHKGSDLWVVRKGATPAFPGQSGFIGGSMGDDAVIVEGVATPEAADALYSTVHGAGRVMGRMAAKRTFSRLEMDQWLQDKGVLLSGGDLDESPMAYKRLPEVLTQHRNTIAIKHVLKPFVVLMAGNDEVDPYKD